MFIPDPGSRIWIFSIPDPGSRMSIKEFKYFNKKKWFLSSQKYDPSFWSRIRIPDLDPYFLPIPDPDPGSQIPNPGIKKATDPWSQIQDSDSQHWRFQICSGSMGKHRLLTFNGRCCLNNSFNGSALRSLYVQKRILRIFYFHIISLIFTVVKFKFMLFIEPKYCIRSNGKSQLSSFSVYINGCKLLHIHML